MDYESVESFAREIFNVIWYKHELSLSAFSRNEVLKNHAQFHRAEAIANAVICKQHIYRVLYKDFFIRNFPDFIVSKNLFRKFVFDLTRQICTYPEYDFFEKLWNTCAFVAEMHLFCLSRALDVNLKAAPGLWAEVLLRFLREDCVGRSWDEVVSQATSRYSKLYSLLEPFMLPRTPYKTVLLIDHLSTMLRDTTVFSQSDECTPDDLPDEIFLLLRELCFALEASDEFISMIKLEHLNKIEVTPPITEHDYKFLDAVLFNLAPVTEEEAEEDSDSFNEVTNTVSIKSNASAVKTTDPTISLVATSNSEICDIQGGEVNLKLSDSQSATGSAMPSTSQSAPMDRLLETPENDLATAAKQSDKDGKSKESSLKSKRETGKNLGRRGTSIQLKESIIKTFSVEQGSSISSEQLKTQTRKSFPAYSSRPGIKSKDLDKPETRSKKLSVDVKSIPKTRSTTVCSSGAKSDPKTGIAVSTLEEKSTRKTRSTAISLIAASSLKTRNTAPKTVAASTQKTRNIASSSVALSTPKTRSAASNSVGLSTPKTRSTASNSVGLSTPKTRSTASSSAAASNPKTRSTVSSSAAMSTPKTRSAVSSSVATSTPKPQSVASSFDTKSTPKTRSIASRVIAKSTPKK